MPPPRSPLFFPLVFSQRGVGAAGDTQTRTYVRMYVASKGGVESFGGSHEQQHHKTHMYTSCQWFYCSCDIRFAVYNFRVKIIEGK